MARILLVLLTALNESKIEYKSIEAAACRRQPLNYTRTESFQSCRELCSRSSTCELIEFIDFSNILHNDNSRFCAHYSTERECDPREIGYYERELNNTFTAYRGRYCSTTALMAEVTTKIEGPPALCKSHCLAETSCRGFQWLERDRRSSEGGPLTCFLFFTSTCLHMQEAQLYQKLHRNGTTGPSTKSPFIEVDVKRTVPLTQGLELRTEAPTPPTPPPSRPTLSDIISVTSRTSSSSNSIVDLQPSGRSTPASDDRSQR